MTAWARQSPFSSLLSLIHEQAYIHTAASSERKKTKIQLALSLPFSQITIFILFLFIILKHYCNITDMRVNSYTTIPDAYMIYVYQKLQPAHQWDSRSKNFQTFFLSGKGERRASNLQFFFVASCHHCHHDHHDQLYILLICTIPISTLNTSHILYFFSALLANSADIFSRENWNALLYRLTLAKYNTREHNSCSL